jgi:hypothetical protein
MTLHRRHHAITLMQAAEDSPTLARLAELARQSSTWLRTIQPLLPVALRGAVKAGPIDGDSWCLLVSGNAAAAKLRQVTPALLTSLRSQGFKVNSIRLKVQMSQPT